MGLNHAIKVYYENPTGKTDFEANLVLWPLQVTRQIIAYP